jgi:hypothetical protein
VTNEATTLDDLVKRLDATRRWLLAVGVVALVALGGWRVQTCRLQDEVSSKRIVLRSDDGQAHMTFEQADGPRLVISNGGGRMEMSIDASGTSRLLVTAPSATSAARLTVSDQAAEFELNNAASNAQVLLRVDDRGATTRPERAFDVAAPILAPPP